MKNVTFVAVRIDNQVEVFGHYFKTPLTSENFEADSFQSGKTRHCISDKYGVVFEIDYETLRVSDIDGKTYIDSVDASNTVDGDYDY